MKPSIERDTLIVRLDANDNNRLRLLLVAPPSEGSDLSSGAEFQMPRIEAVESHLDVYTHRENRHDDRFRLADIASDPLSEQCIALASRWLNNCALNHLACKQNMSPTLPTRVLDLGVAKIVLLETQGLTGRYTALSYCWGGHSSFTTTRSNLKSRMARTAGIPELSMPRTLLDAVKVTRRLGVRYLWIDSICIIQDSKEDWTHESAMMGQYYRNAYFTISALDSLNSRQGFLTPRNMGSGVQLPRHTGVYIRSALPPWHDILQYAPLNDRGWALQELLLSTRILHYSKGEMLWECLTCCAREASTVEKTIVALEYEYGSWEGENLKRTLSPANADSMTKTEIFGLWRHIVRYYSGRSLTRFSDTLPALSGLASKVEEATKSRYLAGIWQDDFAHGLLWERDINALRTKKVTNLPPLSKRGPSWSWVSLGSAVSFRLENERYHGEFTKSHLDAQLNCARITTDGSNSLGKVIDGTLNLKAYTRFARIMANRDVYSCQLIDEESNVTFAEGNLDYKPNSGTNWHRHSTPLVLGFHSSKYSLQYCKIAWISQRLLKINREESTLIVVFLMLSLDPAGSGQWKRIGRGSTLWKIKEFDVPEQNGSPSRSRAFDECDVEIISIS